jgi:hypothetical protein
MNPSQLALPRRKRPPVASVAAVVGLVAAAAWFVSARQVANAAALRQQQATVDRGVELVGVLRRLAQERAAASARLLAEDPRLTAALAVPELDRTTLLDLLGDLHQVDEQLVLAVLTPTGRVRAVLGAPELDGVDLGTSAAVKTAASQRRASAGAWLVGGRVAEVAVAAVRVDDATVGLVLAGVQLSDDDLHGAAQAAGVHLALLVGDAPAWSSAPGADDDWTAPGVRRVEVNESVHYAVTAAVRTPEYLVAFAWAVPLGVLLFATLAFWRGGAP